MPEFPFTAVAGQTLFKLALILNAISPAIGGVLVSGPRGSAKSTLARGLADVLPATKGLAHSFVNLPLGTTEEMLLGTLNLQQVLAEQSVAFQPGLLAKAHGGVLYVDEVNLLPDHLVDVLLDVAASGQNVVERDGVSHRHAARFTLLGTMNPDEGELRPQLLDRFGLAVEVHHVFSIEERVDIVMLREAYDADPQAFYETYAHAQVALTQRIEQARIQLAAVGCSQAMRVLIAKRCDQAHVDGLRADIVWFKAAVAHAAWHQRTAVLEEDVLAVEELVLTHRRKTPPHPHTPPNKHNGQHDAPPSSPCNFSRPPEKGSAPQSKGAVGDWGAMNKTQASLHTREIQPLALNVSDSLKNNISSEAGATSKKKGRSRGQIYTSANDSTKVSWFTTLVKNQGVWPPRVLRFQKKKSNQAVLNIVVLDTSASTLDQQLFAKAKGVILQIAHDAYLAREQFTLFGFGNDQIDVLVSKRRAPKALKRCLDDVQALGGTPLRKALEEVGAYQQQQRKHNPAVQLHTYLITDGRTTQHYNDLSWLGNVTVIDIEQAAVKRGKAKDIAQVFHAAYVPLPV